MFRRPAFSLTVIVATLIGCSVEAQPLGRSFVSAQTGSDLNPCTPTSPCRTFARALTVTQVDGELIVLDSGGYGPNLTINQGVQIQAPAGVYAGITTTTGDAITVNAPSASVVLKGLTINHAGGTDAIAITAVQALHVENCTITGFSSGIVFDVAGSLFVRESTFRRNSESGILLNTSTGIVLASIDHCTFEKNDNGVWVDGNAKATVRGSLAFGQTHTGYRSQIAGSELTVENCVATHNANGISAFTSGVVRVSNSTVTNNGIGFRNPDGTFLSRTNNTVEGNTTDKSGTIGTYNAQ
jgi:nitrous oxidase accessory protein NosD